MSESPSWCPELAVEVTIAAGAAGMPRLLLLVGCWLLFAQAADAAQEEHIAPMVQVDVIVELDAVNESLRSTSDSIGEISESLRLMAESGELSPAREEQLSRVLENLDSLVHTSTDSVNALPSLVQRLRTSVVSQSKEILDDFKFWSAIIIGALFTLLILLAIGFYFLVLRPLQKTILSTFADVSKIAAALEDTARALETNNAIQSKLLEPRQKPEAT